MANSYTANYQLNQWAASDQFLRTEFNADNQKIDAALKALANMDATIDGEKCGVKSGVYVGDGAESRTIQLGVAPQAVFLTRESYIGVYDNVNYGGLATAGAPLAFGGNLLLEVTASGFQVHRSGMSNGIYRADGNELNTPYRYLAFY